MRHPEGFAFLPAYEDQDIQSLGREPAKSPWKAYDTTAQALEGKPSPNVLRLEGACRFRLYPRPEAVEEGFFEPGFGEEGFVELRYPGAWELQGQGEPIYTNVPYPWPYEGEGRHLISPLADGKNQPNPPFAPEDNPTGCYRIRFHLPEGFEGKELYLRFDGVETAFYCWINGKPAGFSKDSKLPAEFRVTEQLHAGENLLALMVLRFADASYLEDQDYWHLSGIHRGVFLTAKPAYHIHDCFLKPWLDPERALGALTADVQVSRVAGYATGRVRLELFDPEGKPLAQAEAPVQAAAQYNTRALPSAATARLRLELEGVRPWEPESPTLYTAVISLLDASGRVVDVESYRTGFRSIQLRQGVVYFNGKRLLVRGVNRHDFCWQGGRTVPREHMVEEIRQMKRMGINAVRTCHYPDDPAWYELCDELGLLLVCECNLETHGLMGQLSHDPSWAKAYLERAVRMVQTFKNHVSIFSWSLGNESGTGANHAAMYGFIKEYDPTRLCQYEAGQPGKNVSDLRGDMYATIANIERMLADPQDDRPIILVEYLYQIRNSGGGLHKLRPLLEKYPRFQGGFVWDWQDKALCGRTRDGKPYFAHGGDFGESWVEPENPPYMTNNGVVLADLRWKPVAWELKQAYAPVWVQRPEPRSAWDTLPAEDLFVVKNRSAVFCLDHFAITARLRENGRLLEERAVELPNLGPMEEQAFRFSIPHERKPGCEYHLEFVCSLREGCWYAPAGYVLGHSQFALQAGQPAIAEDRRLPLRVEETKEAWRLGSGELVLELEKQSGRLSARTAGGAHLWLRAPVPCLDRPYTGLDARAGWGWFDALAQVRQLQYRPSAPSLLIGEQEAQLRQSFLLTDGQGGQGGAGELRYLLSAGRLHISMELTLAQAYAGLPRVGVELLLPQGLERLRYFGRGPEESYPDRPLAGLLQEVETTVRAEHFPIAPPSENGGHEGLRWLTLTDGQGGGLRIRCDSPLHFDAHHNAVAEYQSAQHDHELPVHGETWLHLDAAHSPIGSDLAWSTAMPEEQALRGGGYHLGFTLEPLV